MGKPKLITVANQKGGVGKTTTVFNLGYGLAREEYKVLFVDLDAQANLTESMGIDPDEVEKSSYDLFRRVSWEDIALDLDGVYLIPGGLDLVGVNDALAGKMAREKVLKKALADLNGFDFVFMDCPANLGLTTLNAMVAADEILVPVELEFYSLSGLRLISGTIQDIATDLDKDTRLSGVIVTKYDKRKTLNRDVLKKIRGKYGSLVYESLIRSNVAIGEAPSCGVSIFEHQPKSHGAEDFGHLTKEFLKRMEVK